jgi:outer membrane protein assembly factor BamB
LNRTTHEQKWSTTLKNGQDYTGGALIAGEMLYIVWKHIDIQGRPDNAALFALDAQTGQEQWRFEARDLDVFPLVEHDHVFIVSNQGIEAEETNIYALH